MDAHVGSNGPGAIGKSNFTSGELGNAPSGTLSAGNAADTSGIGGKTGRANVFVAETVNTSATTMVGNRPENLFGRKPCGRTTDVTIIIFLLEIIFQLYA